MKKYIVAIVGFVALATSAEAGLVCANAPEMKVLQSAALQQQLMVAAETCHMSADYNAFVTAYRDRLLLADQYLKAFFAGRPRGEDYNAYKTRIANKASLRSLKDARFCESAQKIFDMALGRAAERNGLAPEPPQLIDTGYEGCRPVDDKLIEAAVIPRPSPHPSIKVALAPKPAARRVAVVPTARPAKPVVTARADHALAMAPHASVPRPLPTKPIQVAAAAPKPPALKPVAPSVVAPAPSKQAVPTIAAAPPPKPMTRVASAAPRPLPPLPRTAAPTPSYTSPAEPDAFDEPAVVEEAPRDAAKDAPPYETAPEPNQRFAAVEQPMWREPENRPPTDDWRSGDRPNDDPPGDGLTTDDHIPNAYRPGATWVNGGRPAWRPTAAWHPASYPPRWRRPPPHASYLVLGPDGRWVVVIGRGPRWGRD